MNLTQLKKNRGYHVKLVPTACRLDGFGQPLPELEEDWFVADVTDDVITLTRTGGHVAKLGPDHIHHFTSDPQRSVGDAKFGFLTLHVQVFIQGVELWVKPNNRPGEPMSPPIVQIEDWAVDFNFPTTSGIQQRLEAEGYKLSWASETRLTTLIEVEGWEIVVEKFRDGKLCRFRAKDPCIDQVLIKKHVR